MKGSVSWIKSQPSGALYSPCHRNMTTYRTAGVTGHEEAIESIDVV